VRGRDRTRPTIASVAIRCTPRPRCDARPTTGATRFTSSVYKLTVICKAFRKGCPWLDRWRASRSSNSVCGFAGPAAGGILADWGADVIKIEGSDGRPGPNVRPDARHRGRGEPSVRDGQPRQAQRRARPDDRRRARVGLRIAQRRRRFPHQLSVPLRCGAPAWTAKRWPPAILAWCTA